MNKFLIIFLMICNVSSYAESPLRKSQITQVVKVISSNSKEKVYEILFDKESYDFKIKEIELNCEKKEVLCSFFNQKEGFLDKQVDLKVQGEEENVKNFNVF